MFLEHMKRLQNMPLKGTKRGKQAGWCDYNFPTEYTAAFRLCSREAIQLVFLLVHILGITAVAWQTTQHRAGGAGGSVLCHSIFLSQVHVSPFISHNSRPIHQKTHKIALRKEKKSGGNGFPVLQTTNCYIAAKMLFVQPKSFS